MIRLLVLLFILLSACNNPIEYFTENDSGEEIETPTLILYMNTEYQDSTGYYIVDYPDNNESSYMAVEYFTQPLTRVFWYSEDTYTFIYWGQELVYPIITNSTYSSNVGEGRQLIYLYQDHIGDTLSVDGCISNECVRLYFIVK